MKKKKNYLTSIIIIIVIILAVGCYFYLRQEAKAPSMDDSQTGTMASPTVASITPSPRSIPTATGKPPATGSTNTAPAAGGGETTGSDIQVLEVDYTDDGFSPQSISINGNDYIFFKNKSSKSFWPTAAPTGGYPSFDAGKQIAPGSEYKFQFTKAGTFHYENKLNPSETGTVAVK